MERISRTVVVFVAVCTVVLASIAPGGIGVSGGLAAAAEPGPPLVVEGDVVDIYSSDPSGVRVDPWVIWVCNLEPGGTVPERLAIAPDDVIAVLEAQIRPYYRWLSRGAYEPTYTAGGSIAAGTNDPDTALSTCLTAAVASPVSAGFAGALVIANAPIEDAVGESGHQDCGSPPCVGSATLPGNNRTIQLGAHDLFTTTTVGTPWLAETTHEFGHTIDWGHGGPGPAYRAHESLTDYSGYQPTAADAPWVQGIDPGLFALLDPLLEGMGFPSIESDLATLGSATVYCNVIFTEPETTPGWSFCLLLSELEYGDLYEVMASDPSPLTTDTLDIPQTQVFNRYAAGWIDDDEIETHTAGYAEYQVVPVGVEGTQMLVLPGSDRRRYVTIEARAATDFMPDDAVAGVMVHLVDQRPGSCGGSICWGDTDWKTMVYEGSPWNRDQLLEPGDALTVEGEHVEVMSANEDGTYTIRIGHPPDDPATPGAVPAPAAVVATPVGRQPGFTG